MMLVIPSFEKKESFKEGGVGSLSKIVFDFDVDKSTPLEDIVRCLRKVKLLGLHRVNFTILNLNENPESEKDEDEENNQKKQFKEDNSLLAECRVIADRIEEEEGGMQGLAEKLVRSISEILEKNHLSSLDINMMGNDADTIQMIDFVAQNSRDLDFLTKLEILSEADPNKRLDFLINSPNRGKIDDELNRVVKKSIQKDQEAYYLLKKKEAIEKKLRESRGYASEEMKKILEKLDAEHFPKRIKKLVYQKIDEMGPSNSSEANVLRTYVSWVMKTPWWQETKEINDLERAKRELDEKHSGLEEVKGRIIEYLAVRQRVGKSFGQVICLLGPPGVGKTSLASSIAKATGRKFVSISLGGVSDEAEIRGHRSTYIGAYPGRIVKALCKTQTINPVILIDEIDKIGHSVGRGDPAFALLEVLDPSSNDKFIDNYLGDDAFCDLSEVFFICTANYAEDIPESLVDRLEIISLSSYTVEEKVKIAKEHLIPEFVEKYRLLNNEIEFTDSSLREIIEYYTREAGVRNFKGKIDTVFRKLIVQLDRKEKESLLVTTADVKDYLKKKLFDFTTPKLARPGVFNGLAYTGYGGDILPIEVVYYERKEGDREFTGNLGEILKESCQVSLTYIRANAVKFGIDPDFFSKNCIHIHVMSGACPKDGPSAGVALTTAIISAITEKAVPEYFGATGEITLHGWVEAIGGLKEKAIASQRKKLKTIFIPKDNEKDIEDIPEEVRKDLEIILVSTYEDVWRVLFKSKEEIDQ